MNQTIKKIKKITSLLLVLTIVFAFSYSTVTLAAPKYEFRQIVDLADGTFNHIHDSTKSNVAVDTEKTFGTGKSTIKWSLDSDPFIAYPIVSPRDDIKPDFENKERTNAVVTFRFYSEAKGAVVNVLPCSKDGTETPDSRGVYTFTISSTGWQEASIKFTNYMYSNITTDGFKFIAESGSGDIWFDSVWFEREPFSTVPTMELTSASIENNTSFVSAELDGNNTIIYEFPNNIGDFDAENAVEVYEFSGGEEVLTSQAYSVTAEDNKLNVTFESPLKSPVSYRIILNDGLVEDERGRALGTESNIVFSVGKGSPYFTAEPALENEAEVGAQSDFRYDITLSSDFPDESLIDYITVYKNGEKLRGGISAEKSDTTLAVIFDTLEADCTYHIVLSGDFEDAYGTPISGETTFVFKTEKSDATGGNLHMYSSAANVAATATGATSEMIKENTKAYSQTTKLSFKAGDNARFDMIKSLTRTDITGMNYMNCWIYNPEPSDNILMYFIAIPGAEKRTTYASKHKLDWTGWKLVSAPFTDFDNMLSDSFFGTADQIRVAFTGFDTTTTSDGYILLDDAWLSANEAKAPEVISVNYPDKSIGVSIFNTSLEFEFDAELDSIPQITVTDELGNEFTEYTAELSSNVLGINFGTLAPLTEYKVSLSGAKSAAPAFLDMKPYEMSFVTAMEGVEVQSIDFNQNVLSISQDAKAQYNINNSTGKAVDITLHLAAYDDNSNFIALKTATKSPASNAEYELSLTSAEIKDASVIKAFVTTGDMKLVSDCFALLGQVGTSTVHASYIPSAEGSDAISFDSVALNSADLKISGALSGVKDVVMIQITDSEGKSIVYEPISASSSGFDYEYTFADSVDSSKLTIKAITTGISGKHEILYVSADDRKALVELANGSDEKALSDFIEDNAGILGFESHTSTMIDDIATILIENKSYSDYEEVVAKINEFITVFEGLNDLIWSELADYIITNNKLLLDDNEYYDDFKSASKDDRNACAKELFKKLPVASLSDFRDEFSDIADEELSSDNSKGNGGGSKGSGGGGSSVAVVPPKSEIVPQVPEKVVVFDDLSGFEWASESILSLNAKGIVSSDPNKKFRPSDSITREEFVKLVVSLIYGNVTEVNHSFTDEVSGSWYCPYLSKAYETGIITGNPDGSFGIGNTITREDMAVIIYRAYILSGNDFADGEKMEFTDIADVSDYASDAVNLLSANSVINGTGSGAFEPKANANRAQAAVIIDRVSKLN